MTFSFRPHRLLTAATALCLAFLTGFSANAQDLLEREYNAPNDGETLNIEANQTLLIKCNVESASYTFNNYSGFGDVYYYAQKLSYISNGVPSGFTGSKIFIAGNALGLPNSQTSSDVYGSGRILVLTNEVPGATDTVFEGTLFNASGSSPTYDNDIQIKGVGGLRVGWGGSNLILTVSGKISDYTDGSGNVTPGKLIIERDANNVWLTNGSNNYSGGTQIGGGNVTSGGDPTTLTIQVDGTPLGTGPVSFGQANSSLALNNHAITVGGFDGGTTGTVSGADTLIINTGTNNYTAPVTINNVANLTITGTGSQSVAATNVTNLTVSSGEMSVSGALNVPGSITIANGATLKMDGANSSLTAGNPVTIQNGATLYFNNAAPRNPADTPLAINIENGGTLEFHEIDTGESRDNTTLVKSSNKISITGSGNFIKSGSGDLFLSSGSGVWQGLTIVLDSNATIDVREGCLANGNYFPDSWKSTLDDVTTYNQATLNVGPNGTVDLWDGIMYVGGITGNVDGENHGQIISPKYNSTLVVGMGMDAEKSFVYNGDVDLPSGRNFTKEGKTTQVMAGTYSNLGNTNVNDGTLEISGTATLGTVNVNGGTLEISSNDATLKTSNLNGGSLDVSGTATMEVINFTDGGKLNVIQNGVVTMPNTTNLNQYTNITVAENASFIVDPGNDGEPYVAQSQQGKFNITGKVTVKSGYFRVIDVPDTATIVLDGGTLQNNGNSGIYQSTVDANIILASDSQLMGGWGGSNGSLTVNGVISGEAKLIIRNDGGTVYVNNTNVHTGGTQIGDDYKNHSALLVMGADNALGTGPISFGAVDSTLNMATYSQVFNGIDNQNGSGGNFTGDKIINDANLLESPTFNAAEGTNFVYTGTMPASSGTLTKVGAGTQVLGSADVENIVVTEGTLGFSGVLNATGDISIATGTTFKMYGTASSLNAANPIEIQDGATLYFENAVPRNGNNDLAINIEEGGTLKFSETDAGEHNDNNSLVRNASKNVTITGDGDFIKTGTGRLFITNQSNSSKVSIVLSDKAVIDVQEGDLVNGGWSPNCWQKTVDDVTTYNQATLNVGPNGAVDLWDGTLYVGGIIGDIDGDNHGLIKSQNNGKLVVGMGMTDTKTFTYNGDLDLTNFGKTVPHSDCTFTKEGETTQSFTGTYFNLGVTNVNNGALTFSGNTTLGTVNFNGDGKIDVTDGVLTFGRSINLTETLPLTIASGVLVIVDPGNDGEQYVAQAYTDSFKIHNKFIAKSGFFRVTNVSSATELELDGGTLQNNGNNGGGNATVNTDILLTSDSRLMAGWSGSLTVDGVISGTGKLIIRNDSGSVHLKKSNTYTGGTQIGDDYLLDTNPAARLVAEAENVLGTGRLYFGRNDSTFDMKGHAQTIGGLGKDMSADDEVQYKGSVNNSGAETTLTLNVPEGETYNFNGSVANNVNIVKTGAGTQQFNLADGATFAKSIIVSTGRLDMKEYFKGTLEVKTGGVFSPGNSVGTLYLTGDFTAESGSTLLFEQDETGIDQLIILSGGTINIAEDAILELAMTSPIPGATYTIIEMEDGLPSDYASVDFWNGLLSPVSAYYWNLTVDGNTILAAVDANAVPEPSTWALLVLGVIGLLYWRKRK